MSNYLIEKTIYEFFNTLNESRSDKLAIRFLKSKGITDYDQQMKIIGSLKHDIPNIRECHGKFVLGGLRCYYGRQLSNADDISAFDKALGYIFKGNHQDDYDENLNGLSVKELADTYKDIMKGDLQSDIERSNNRIFNGDSDYEIIPIEKFDDAKKYKKYTSWCVTQSKSAFDSYTCKGVKRFYFCLKKGFETVPEKAGADAPLDEYGLSMISVLIDNTDGGSVDRITTRWNHEHNGENNKALCTAEQLEDIIKLPFYKTIKAYTKEELHDRGIVTFDDVQDMLDKGIMPKNIFDEVNRYIGKYARVHLHDKNNFITKNKNHRILVFKNWYEYLGNVTNNEYARVKITGKGYNIIDMAENIILPTYYNHLAETGRDNLLMAQRNDGKYNFINTAGKVQFTDWFDMMNIADSNYVLVAKNGKYNYINMDNVYMSETWYASMLYYKNYNLVKVKNDDNLYNVINLQGELLLPDWHNNIEILCSTRIKIYDNGKYNIIDIDKGPISNTGYSRIELLYGYSDIYAVCNGNDDVALMDSNGHVITKWYKNIYTCDDNIKAINKDGKVNFLTKEGNPVFDKWYNDIGYFKNGYATVELNGKYNIIDEAGHEQFNDWFGQCFSIINDFVKVIDDDKYNFVDNNTGKIFSDIWFDYAHSFVFSPDYTVVYFAEKPIKMHHSESVRLYYDEEYQIQIYNAKNYNVAKSFYFEQTYNYLKNIGYVAYILGKNGKLYNFDIKSIMDNNYNYLRDAQEVSIAELNKK